MSNLYTKRMCNRNAISLETNIKGLDWMTHKHLKDKSTCSIKSGAKTIIKILNNKLKSMSKNATARI